MIHNTEARCSRSCLTLKHEPVRASANSHRTRSDLSFCEGMPIAMSALPNSLEPLLSGSLLDQASEQWSDAGSFRTEVMNVRFWIPVDCDCSRPLQVLRTFWRRKMKTKHTHLPKEEALLSVALASLVLLLMAVSVQAQEEIPEVLPEALPAPTSAPVCERTIKADVVALDQAIMYNRLGTVNPNGMIYALKQDVVAIDPSKGLVAGNVRLRSDKRPRPIVLRMNSGDCLRITFTNLLSSQSLSVTSLRPARPAYTSSAWSWLGHWFRRIKRRRQPAKFGGSRRLGHLHLRRHT